jgi:energy-coupling factor transporter ATP-binding protein EcfA2
MAARLERLNIHHFRGVASETELTFADGINVILGKNGTGKTTLLDLVAKILSGDLRALERQVFHIAFTIAGGDWKLHAQIRNERREGNGAPFRPSVGLDVEEHAGGKSSLQLDETHALTRDPQGRERELPPDIGSPLHIRWLLPEMPLGDIANFFEEEVHRYDEMLGSYERMMASELYLGRSGKRVELYEAFLPASVMKVLRHANADTIFAIDTFPFLGRVADLFGVRSIDVQWRLIERRNDDDEIVERAGPPTFRFHTTTGMFTQDILSYGQKRLLSFQYYLAAFPYFVVADELVNGLHHSWIEACINDIGSRQAFLTSQNPLLVDYLPRFDGPQQLSRMFILCRPAGERSYSWENMSIEEAESMFSAYEAGIQPVGEILQSKGLW